MIFPFKSQVVGGTQSNHHCLEITTRTCSKSTRRPESNMELNHYFFVSSKFPDFPDFSGESLHTRSRPAGRWGRRIPICNAILNVLRRSLHQKTSSKHARMPSDPQNHPKSTTNHLEPPKDAQNLQNPSKIEDFRKSSWIITILDLPSPRTSKSRDSC